MSKQGTISYYQGVHTPSFGGFLQFSYQFQGHLRRDDFFTGDYAIVDKVFHELFLDVTTRPSINLGRDERAIDVHFYRGFTRIELDDLGPIRRGRYVKQDFFFKPATQGWIEQVRLVRRADRHDILIRFHAIQLREQCRCDLDHVTTHVLERSI